MSYSWAKLNKSIRFCFILEQNLTIVFVFVLLIQRFFPFQNVIFCFRSQFFNFECFRFVSLSKQFDMEALLLKNLYYRWHPYTRPPHLLIFYFFLDFLQHAREYIDFAQYAMKYKDFTQYAREYIDFSQHAREYIDSHSMQGNQ